MALHIGGYMSLSLFCIVFSVRFRFLCSLKCYLVELQISKVVPLSLGSRKIASMPTPSSNLDRLIVLVKQTNHIETH